MRAFAGLWPKHSFADDALYLSGKITAQDQKIKGRVITDPAFLF